MGTERKAIKGMFWGMRKDHADWSNRSDQHDVSLAAHDLRDWRNEQLPWQSRGRRDVQQPEPKRTAEIRERMLAAGLPIWAVICS